MTIKMYYAGASTCVLEIDEKIKIGIDPALSPANHKLKFKNFESTRKKAPIYQDLIFNDIDIWLITHPHEDHVDVQGKRVISQNSTIICDKKTAKSIIFERGQLRIQLDWRNSYTFEKEDYSINITAIPAYHGNSILSRTLAGKVNGYLLDISGNVENRKIYFTGDTVYHRDVICALPSKIDTLIANLGNVKSEMYGGPLTMNMEMLHSFIKRLNPKKVIPIHIDDFSHYETTIEEVAQAGIDIFPSGQWVIL